MCVCVCLPKISALNSNHESARASSRARLCIVLAGAIDGRALLDSVSGQTETRMCALSLEKLLNQDGTHAGRHEGTCVSNTIWHRRPGRSLTGRARVRARDLMTNEKPDIRNECPAGANAAKNIFTTFHMYNLRAHIRNREANQPLDFRARSMRCSIQRQFGRMHTLA